MAENNKNNQVLLIQSEEETEPSKWTWARYGKSIAKFKYWVIGFTLGLGVIGFLGIQFVYNPLRTNFSAKFSYNLPLVTDNDGNSTFVDGSPFSYYNIISYDNLASVKASNKDFSKIDVKRITKDNELSIAINGYTDSKTNQFTISAPISYTISGKLNSLGNQDVATSFVHALIDSVRAESQTKVDSYSIPNILPTSFDSLDYDEQIDKLSDQYDGIDDILSGLESILSTPSNSGSSSDNTTSEKVTQGKKSAASQVVVVGDENGTPVQTIRSNFELRYKSGGASKFTTVLGELDVNHYVNLGGDTSDDNIQAKIEQLTYDGMGIKNSTLPTLIADINTYKSTLQTLVSGTTANATMVSKYSALIETTTKEKNDCVNKLRSLGFAIPDSGVNEIKDIAAIKNPDDSTNTSVGKIQKLKALKGNTSEKANWTTGCDAFQTKINGIKSQLLQDIADGSKVYRFVNNKYRNSVNYFVYPGIISVSGNISSAIGAAVGVVLGYLATSLICCGVYISQIDKKEENGAIETKK